MMYQQFRPGVRSRVFGLRLELVTTRGWEHWDALRFALGVAHSAPLA